MREKADSFTNPLPQKADYDLEDHLIYGKQKGWKKVLEWIFTIFAWGLLLSYVIYLVYGMLAVKNGWYLPEFTIYNREMVMEIRKYFFFLFIVLLVVIVLLIFWKNYNRRRFGNLHRRKFRPPVDNKELADMFELDEQMVEKMQNDRYILLETNIVPENLGIGGKNPKEDTYEDEKEEHHKRKYNL